MIGADDGLGEPERVLEVEDPASGLEAVVAVDRTVDGLAVGGVRRSRHETLAEAREEAFHRARATTLRCALAELPAGGARTVVLDADALDPPAAYRALGEAIDELDGTYLAGPATGPSGVELDRLREVTDHVPPRGNAPADATAQGVLAGVRGALATVDSEPMVEGSRFVVRGYGRVGRRVADQLSRAGGEVLVAETNRDARDRAGAAGHRLVDPGEATSTVCDVLVTCEAGQPLAREADDRLPARAVCGDADDRLAGRKVARVLHDRGVAYAPSVLVDAGAVIEAVRTSRRGCSPRVLADVDRGIEAIEDRVADVLERSRREDTSPREVVLDRVRERLEGS